MLWCNVFQLIVSIHQIEALLEGINFHISGFKMFPAVSKLLKHPPSTFSKWKKTLQFSVVKVFLSKYHLIMPTIPKLSWKYCKSLKIKFIFAFLFFFLIFIHFWQTVNIFKSSTFCHTLRTEKNLARLPNNSSGSLSQRRFFSEAYLCINILN